MLAVLAAAEAAEHHPAKVLVVQELPAKATQEAQGQAQVQEDLEGAAAVRMRLAILAQFLQAATAATGLNRAFLGRWPITRAAVAAARSIRSTLLLEKAALAVVATEVQLRRSKQALPQLPTPAAAAAVVPAMPAALVPPAATAAPVW